jgi:mRNA interferase MazF
MIRGEICSVSLPIGTGREQGGQRPAVIVQDALYGQRSPLVLIVPLTSQLNALRFSATVQIDPSSQNGLTLSPVEFGAVLDELNKLTGQ